MEFRILGPLEALSDGRPVSLGGARQRAVLAILLTRANEVVSADRLIEELWGGEPPETAQNVLQGYVSHLRKALGPSVIATRPPGYMVEVEPGQLDLHRFERLVEEARRALEQGDPARASAGLAEALALWRGPALADFTYEPFAQAEIARLEELRLAGIERRIDADLALGRHAELVGEVEALVGRHPLRERLRAHLMLALYRAGRQAEALDAYQDARRALVDELGIDPSPTLQELERAILRQEPSLEPGRLSVPAAGDVPIAEIEFPERSILLVPPDGAGLDALLALAEPLSQRPRREIVLAMPVATEEQLGDATRILEARRAGLVARGVPARAAAFTSRAAGLDVIALARDQETELVLVGAPDAVSVSGVLGDDLTTMLIEMPCDVGVLFPREGLMAPSSDRAVLVPFGGTEHEWAAVETGAWIARAHGSRLRLLGTAAGRRGQRRDASRLLARAALMVQRLVAVPTEPVLVKPGDEAVIENAAGAGLVVLGLSPRWRAEGLGSARLEIVRRAPAPVLVLRRGLRPGGLAPKETMTQFTWTLATPSGDTG